MDGVLAVLWNDQLCANEEKFIGDTGIDLICGDVVLVSVFGLRSIRKYVVLCVCLS